jgi:UDP-N-acetylmuramoyl-L-alanyl-D-glutamate--2,6-diaminopimelate ligase
VAVVNADDGSYEYLRPIPADRHLVYGLAEAHPKRPKDVAAVDIRAAPDGTRFTVRSASGAFELRTALVGSYNVSNVLAATSAALALGVPVEAIQRGVIAVRSIVGRMEQIDEGQDFAAIVDFAHTPNALERALETARSLTRGRVIAIFGCAGERDREKRAWMGEISGRLADVTVMTAEDPRRESLDAILDAMARGAEEAGAVEGESYFRVPDRARAIQFAVDIARAGDLVIALGKGHEQSMCYGTEETPWSEHEALRRALRARCREEPSDRDGNLKR